MNEDLILEVRPSWWNFVWHLLFFWLLIPLIVALVRRASLVFSVYQDRVVLEKGFLNKDYKVIFISDIRTIDVRQTIWQRLINIGDVFIASSGTSGYEDIATGLPDPRGIENLILSLRQGQPGTYD